MKGIDVVLGLSGGADSSALFHLFVKSRQDITVWPVHINHGLRGDESDGDEEFCEKLAESYGRPLLVYKADIKSIAAQKKRTVEEAGRDFRYEAFEEARIKYNADQVAVAHTRNDNAETVIMRFFRGTGIQGMAGIPPKRGYIVRPILNADREDVIDYCNRHGLDYRTDGSNADESYTRNWVRSKLIPIVEERINPKAVWAVAGLAEITAKEDAFLDGLAGKALLSCQNPDGSLNISGITNLDDVLKRRVIRIAYERAAGGARDFGRVHILSVIELLKACPGKRLLLPGGVIAIIGYGGLTFVKNKYNLRQKQDFCYETDMKADVYIPERGMTIKFRDKTPLIEKDFKNGCTKAVSYDRIDDKQFTIRTRRPGDWIEMTGHRRELKYCLRSLGIEVPDRESLFYLTRGSEVAAVMSDDGVVFVPDAFKSLLEIIGIQRIITEV